jgi:hypothetical protein
MFKCAHNTPACRLAHPREILRVIHHIHTAARRWAPTKQAKWKREGERASANLEANEWAPCFSASFFNLRHGKTRRVCIYLLFASKERVRAQRKEEWNEETHEME